MNKTHYISSEELTFKQVDEIPHIRVYPPSAEMMLANYANNSIFLFDISKRTGYNIC